MKVFQPALCPHGDELTMYMAIGGAALRCGYGTTGYSILIEYRADSPLSLDDPVLIREIEADAFLRPLIVEQ